MRRILLLFLLLLSALPARAQNVGPITGPLVFNGNAFAFASGIISLNITSPVSTQCLHISTSGVISPTGADCGAGSYTSINIAPGLTDTVGTENTGSQTLPNAGTVYPQLFPVNVSASCTVNTNCNGVVANETGEILIATGATPTLTLPNPNSLSKGNVYTVGSDGTNAFILTTVGGTAFFYGDLGSGTGLSTYTLTPKVDYSLVDTGTAYKVAAMGGATGAGTVTSVGLGVPASSLFGVTGSPVTTSGTLGLTTTGTSGGVAYFSSGTQLNSSGALTAGQAVVGGGAGAAPTPLNATANSMTYFGVGGALSNTAAATNGQFLLGSTGAAPSLGTITAGTDITVTPGAASLTVGLTNNSTTVNGQSCALGGSCTITASAGTVTVGTTTIASGTSNGLLFDNGGVLGNLATGNSSLLVTDGSGVPSIATAIPNGVTATTQAATDNSTKVATTAYVTSAVTASNPAVAVQAATTQASDTSGYTYSNGVGGVGATLTGPTNTALTVDGFTFTVLGQRILVKNDTQSPSGAFNGVYGVTQLQAVGLGVVLTRAADYDQPSDINNTGSVPVVNGTVNGGSSWLLTSTVNTVGTDPLTYTRFSYPALTLTNGQLVIGSTGNNPVAATLTAGTNITVTPGAGSLTVGETNSSTTVNGQTCTLGSSCTITASAGTITVGTTSIAGGGTGGVLYETGGNLLGESAALTSGQAVVGGGAGTAPHVLNAGANTGTYFGASGVLSNTATNYADGKVLIGTTGGNPTIAAMTAGTGIGITNGPGSITINLSTPVSAANGGTGIANSNTLTLNTNTTLPAAPVATHCVDMDSSGVFHTTGSDCGSGAGSVTSVGLSVPASSIFGVTGSPVTTSGTLGLATTGTSGGVPYFSSGTQLSSSAALTSGQAVVGGGAGAAPTALNATANSMSYFGAAGVLANTAAATNGQLLIGSTGAVPALGTLTAGTGIGITNGAGSVTINLSTPVSPANGGTGINNGTNTLTLNAAATSLPAAPASTQCLHMSSAGAVTTTGADCGSAAAQPFNSAMASTTAMSAYGGL